MNPKSTKPLSDAIFGVRCAVDGVPRFDRDKHLTIKYVLLPEASEISSAPFSSCSELIDADNAYAISNFIDTDEYLCQ